MRLFYASAFLLLLAVPRTTSFVPTTFGVRRSACLWAKKVKRGSLGQVAAGGIASTPKKKKSTPKKKAAAAGGAVSPALAEWASSDDDTTTGSTTKETATSQQEATFTKFEKDTSKKSSSRREKQSVRKAQEQERDASVMKILDNLEELLEEKSGASLDDILNGIRPLLSLPSESLRVLTAAKNQQYPYRLAWVGGDDALCHIGTGLHKVPLARMQEVFLEFQGRSRMELLEVIRILGPFPNVRNTLQGDCKVSSSASDNVSQLEIVMDSMVDGTGKEILAGTDDNIRRVPLQVYYSDKNAILAVVPPEDGSLRQDPLQDNGAHALLFVKEDDMDTKLEQLRVN